MANAEHLAILNHGVRSWNAWRRETVDQQLEPDLSRAELAHRDLSHIDFNHTNLFQANLEFSDLFGGVLWGADLRYSKLSDANLRQCDLRDANLSNAVMHHPAMTFADLSGATLESVLMEDVSLTSVDLSCANLIEANFLAVAFMGTILRGATLTNAVIAHTSFANVDLSGVNLDSVRHVGPSSVGIDTILRSKGKISETFLRGAGAPDDVIEYAKSLVHQAIEFYSCFISYSSIDSAFAQRLYSDLVSNGIRCWFAPEDLKIGDRFRVTIDEAIRVYDKLLLVLSDNSVKSPWVEKEVETAFEMERKQNRLMLFPIRLDKAIMNETAGWAADIKRSRHVGNFEDWADPPAYKKAFNQLMRDLKPAP